MPSNAPRARAVHRTSVKTPLRRQPKNSPTFHGNNLLPVRRLCSFCSRFLVSAAEYFSFSLLFAQWPHMTGDLAPDRTLPLKLPNGRRQRTHGRWGRRCCFDITFFRLFMHKWASGDGRAKDRQSIKRSQRHSTGEFAATHAGQEANRPPRTPVGETIPGRGEDIT